MSKTFYKEGDFKLASWEYSGWQSWIFHWHKDEGVWLTCGIACIDYPSCGRCGAPIPEGLVGLWKLHNFDQIQACG